MLKLSKFIPFTRIMDSNDYSFDLNSDIELDKEENNDLPLREKEYNSFFGEEKIISFEKEENISDNFLFTSEISPMNRNNINLFEISENTFPKNQEKSMNKRGRKRRKNLDKAARKNGGLDNFQRKIQVHFLTFLINFCNNALKAE